MVRFCFASVWGHRLANSKEVFFHFQNQLMLGVLIFFYVQKVYLIGLQKHARYIARLTVRFMR